MVLGRRLVVGSVGREVLLAAGLLVVVVLVASSRSLGIGIAGTSGWLSTRLIAFSSGYLPSPHTPLKSSVSIDHTMPPPSPIARAYFALIVMLSMSSYPTH